MLEIQFKKKKVSIVIVTWNAAKFIPFVIDSIEKQNFKDYEVLVIDNSSLDETVNILSQKYKDKVKIVKQKKNLGFSKAYNLGIHWTRGEYILVMNQDLVLDQDFLYESVNFMDKNTRVGALQGKILQWEVASNRRKDIVDNLGVDIYKNHSFVNRLEGERSPKLEKNAVAVFAFSGSCVLLRRQAVEEIKFKQEFFDEDFFMYKEDIDLSWRLRHKNWDIVYYPLAIAYHARTLKQGRGNGDLAIIENRRKKKKYLNYISYRNHLYLLFKNEFGQNFLFYFFPIFWYEFKKVIYVCLFEQYSLRAWLDFFVKLPTMLAKRRQIFVNTKLTPKELRLWIK